MYKFILTSFLLLSGLIAAAQPAGYSPVTDLAKFKEQFTAIAKKTETIKSDFIQEKNLSMLSEKITSKGKFWFKKENLLRMEYTSPFEYLMILNRDNMYIKDGKNENKVSVKSNKIFQQINRIIVNCVQGTVFNSNDFKTVVFESKTGYLVQLTPATKGLKEFFKNIEVLISKKDYAVTGIDMNENSGDSTILHFTNREINTNIPDAIFAIK